MTEQSVTTKVKRDPRLGAWFALMTFSIISLCATTSGAGRTKSGAEKWVISVCSISVGFAFISCLAYFFLSNKFVGEKAEGFVSVFLLLTWVCGLPIIMNPSKGIAVLSKEETGISFVSNANLYFFSWAAFACIVYICGSYARANLKQASDAISSISATPKLAKWYMLLCISIIVVASAAAYHDSQNCHGSDSEPCRRNKFAISLGSVGTFIGLAMSFMANAGKLQIYLETTTAFLVFTLYTAGVAVITFDTGSGITIGNLYFSTWAGFIVSIFLLVECYHGIKEEREAGTSINTATDDPVVKIQDIKATSGDIKVEDLPDAEQPF